MSAKRHPALRVLLLLTSYFFLHMSARRHPLYGSSYFLLLTSYFFLHMRAKRHPLCGSSYFLLLPSSFFLLPSCFICARRAIRSTGPLTSYFLLLPSSFFLHMSARRHPALRAFFPALPFSTFTLSSAYWFLIRQRRTDFSLLISPYSFLLTDFRPLHVPSLPNSIFQSSLPSAHLFLISNL